MTTDKARERPDDEFCLSVLREDAPQELRLYVCSKPSGHDGPHSVHQAHREWETRDDTVSLRRLDQD